MHDRAKGRIAATIVLMIDRQARLARWLLWITPALWSSNYLIARAADGVIAPHLLALLRWTLALAVMLPFTWRQLVRAPRGWWRAERARLLVLGALGMWICGAFVYLGGQTTSALNIGLIYAACPVGIAVCGVLLLHERMSMSQRCGAALALAGVLYVICKGELGNLLAVRFTIGDAWVVAAAVSWVAYSVLLQRWKSALPPAARTAAIVACGVAVLLPFSVAEAWLVPQPPLGAKALLLVVLAALLPGALSYTSYAIIQRSLGASRTGLMLYLSPLYAALLAWLLLGEPPRAYHAVGAALILPSIWLATRRAG
jgi:drug/metabolite transporter (DMT)-like permease